MAAMRVITHALMCLALAACVSDDAATRAGSASAPPAKAAPAAEAEREVEITRHRYSARLREGEPLAFVNEHGDLRLRKSGDGGVHYAAVIQKLDGEKRDVGFGTDRHAGGLLFSVDPPQGWIGRVDASARVPPASALDLRTRDGLIEIKAGNANVIARSEGGAIRYAGAGKIDAVSRRGDVHAALSASDRSRPAGRLSAGGDIELWLMSDMDIVVEAKARGAIAANVAAGVGDVVRSGKSRLTLRLGTGAATLEVDARGDIAIGVLTAPGQPATP